MVNGQLVVDCWSMLDNYALFLCTLTEIAYRQVKKSENKVTRIDLAPNLLMEELVQIKQGKLSLGKIRCVPLLSDMN